MDARCLFKRDHPLLWADAALFMDTHHCQWRVEWVSDCTLLTKSCWTSHSIKALKLTVTEENAQQINKTTNYICSEGSLVLRGGICILEKFILYPLITNCFLCEWAKSNGLSNIWLSKYFRFYILKVAIFYSKNFPSITILIYKRKRLMANKIFICRN